MSQWELRATKRFAKQNKVVLNNERDIMNTFRLMRRLVEEEKVQTKSVRSEAVKQASVPDTFPGGLRKVG
nr:hypothetical protein D3W47_11755 [Deinococcus sp. RM]